MKRFYERHCYSGQPMRKKSRAMMKYHHGTEMSRYQAWNANKDMENLTNAFASGDDANLQTSTDSKNNTVRTYTRKPKMRIEATYSDQNIAVQPDTKNDNEKNYTAKNDGEKTYTTNAAQPMKNCDMEEQITTLQSDADIENFALNIETENPVPPFQLLKGYRIVNLAHVLTWAIKLGEHSKKCTCAKIEFVKESRIGLHSKITMQCTACDKIFEEHTEPLAPSKEKYTKSNKAFVWATLTAGSYYSQSSHILQFLDVPNMSQNHFQNIEKFLGHFWEEHLQQEMIKAGQEEKDIAIAKGNVNDKGVPFITVLVDGGWCKRSYGHNFNAASGIGVIIGKETKKCLHLGIRNKYCSICQRHSSNGTQDNVEPHECFKNFSGPSTAMEADIIVQGFQESEKVHGLQYLEFVGDGDSSVYAKLQENVEYGRQIRKIECVNHVIKNYTKGLYKIQTNTKLPLLGRKILKPKIKKLCGLARKIIVHNSGKPQIMRNDLRSGLNHAFGGHDNCSNYYCKWKKASDDGDTEILPDSNKIEDIKKETLVWSSICAANESIVMKTGRLTTETTNVVENLMSVLAKYNCGKRICLTKRGSFQRRANLTGLAQNTGNIWNLELWKKVYKQSPGATLKTYVLRKEKSRLRQKNSKRRRLFQIAPKAAPDVHYGPKAENPPQDNNMSLDEMATETVTQLQSMQMTDEEIKRVEEATREQHDCDVYKNYRKNRLTSSLFGMICKRRSTTSCNGHVKAILYPSEFSTKDTRLGQLNEPFIRDTFAREYNKEIRTSGFYIDKEFGYIGSSPDGIVMGEEAVMEIKCFPSLQKWEEKSSELTSMNGTLIEKAASTKTNFPLIWENGEIVMNRKHNHFYQVQGQMRVTQKKLCYYIASSLTSEPLTVVKVEADEDFIQDMISKVNKFYISCVLPEVILRRGSTKKQWECISCKKNDKRT